jgi:hypothetical protein
MIKGISRQIIEIKCTDNEYFEKILLFVNTKNSGCSDEFLRKKAKAFSEKFICEKLPEGNVHKDSSRTFAVVMGVASLLLVGVAVICAAVIL